MDKLPFPGEGAGGGLQHLHAKIIQAVRRRAAREALRMGGMGAWEGGGGFAFFSSFAGV